jgi:hypothetical protein
MLQLHRVAELESCASIALSGWFADAREVGVQETCCPDGTFVALKEWKKPDAPSSRQCRRKLQKMKSEKGTRPQAAGLVPWICLCSGDQ